MLTMTTESPTSHHHHAASSRSGAGTMLSDLALALDGRISGDDAPVAVTGVRQDSRAVQEGDVFVALRGSTVDGVRFAPQAVERGAVAVLVEERSDELGLQSLGVPVLVVPRARLAMAQAAAIVYGRPSESLRVVGITGTNGKTTSAHLAQHCIDAAGGSAGIVGTLGSCYGDYRRPATHTSPEADELQRTAASMVARGARELVMEVSSIALAAERVHAVVFDVAVFTNLSQDHLDYHGSMDAYGAAKRKLFFEPFPRVAVINVDDPFGAQLAQELAGRLELIRVSCRPTRAVEITATLIEPSDHGLDMTVITPTGDLSLSLPLVGLHNAQNAVAALGIAHALGCDLTSAARALERDIAVPGRLERCDRPAEDDIIAVVDYAHTPAALANVLASVRPNAAGQLWCVFGCGGDRDAGKRKPMGEVVARGADVAIVTNDNPRSEDPERIADAVVEGLRSAREPRVDGGRSSTRIIRELDRGRAIDRAIEAARPGDLVLVAGKGHESYQVIGDRVASFDDRQRVREALERRRGERG